MKGNTPAPVYVTKLDQFAEAVQKAPATLAQIQYICRYIYGDYTPREMQRVRNLAQRYTRSGRLPVIKTHKFRGVILGFSIRKEKTDADRATTSGVGHERTGSRPESNKIAGRKNTETARKRSRHPDLVAGGVR